MSKNLFENVHLMNAIHYGGEAVGNVIDAFSGGGRGGSSKDKDDKGVMGHLRKWLGHRHRKPILIPSNITAWYEKYKAKYVGYSSGAQLNPPTPTGADKHIATTIRGLINSVDVVNRERKAADEAIIEYAREAHGHKIKEALTGGKLRDKMFPKIHQHLSVELATLIALKPYAKYLPSTNLDREIAVVTDLQSKFGGKSKDAPIPAYSGNGVVLATLSDNELSALESTGKVPPLTQVLRSRKSTIKNTIPAFTKYASDQEIAITGNYDFSRVIANSGSTPGNFQFGEMRRKILASSLFDVFNDAGLPKSDTECYAMVDAEALSGNDAIRDIKMLSIGDARTNSLVDVVRQLGANTSLPVRILVPKNGIGQSDATTLESACKAAGVNAVINNA